MDRKCVIGVLRESKPGEMRVALTPDAVAELVRAGAEIVIERNAGTLCGYFDEAYRAAGAEICDSTRVVIERSDIILKVKEFLEGEIAEAKGKILLGFLHCAGTPIEYTKALLVHDVCALAREHVENHSGNGDRYPMLAPMSRIAGREAMLLAFRHKITNTWSGDALSVSVIGIGISGRAAVKTALGSMYGGTVSEVWMFDLNTNVANLRTFKRELADPFSRVHYSTTHDGIYHARGMRALRRADIIVSAVMIPGGGAAPIVLSEKMLPFLKPGVFTVDIAIDQGGSFAWTKGRPTPPNELGSTGNIIYFAAQNIPGSISALAAKEATDALTRATLPYLLAIVRAGNAVGTPKQALYRVLAEDAGFRAGLVTWEGHLVNRDIAAALGLHGKYRSADMFF